MARSTASVSASGTFLANIRPPEAIDPRRGPSDWRVDVYQAGLVLLQALVGPRKFSQDEILAGEPRKVAEEIAGNLYHPIERMLRRRVLERTPTALDAWRDFQDAFKTAT